MSMNLERARRHCGLLLTVATVCLALPGLADNAQGPPKTGAQSGSLVIRGVLRRPDKAPATAADVYSILALPSEKDAEDSSSLSLSNELLKTNSTDVGPGGRFTLRIRRDSIPRGKRMMIVALTPSGMSPLQVRGKNLAFDLDDKTTSLNLGTILLSAK